MTAPLLLVDGKPIRLGERIGKGGEGEVFALGDGSGRAVKMYTVADAAQRESKIAAMVRLRLAERSSLVAFPIAVVRSASGRFAGFVMNLVREHKPLFELYSPGARKQNFPEADYRFLVRAAAQHRPRRRFSTQGGLRDWRHQSFRRADIEEGYSRAHRCGQLPSH